MAMATVHLMTADFVRYELPSNGCSGIIERLFDLSRARERA